MKCLYRILFDYNADYLEVTDSMLQSLMMRHRTLSDTNLTLVENLTTMSDRVRDGHENVIWGSTMLYNVAQVIMCCNEIGEIRKVELLNRTSDFVGEMW